MPGDGIIISCCATAACVEDGSGPKAAGPTGYLETTLSRRNKRVNVRARTCAYQLTGEA